MDAILVVKTTLVLSGALLAAPLLRRAAPVTRHRYWSATFAAVHLLPLLILTVPAFGVPLPFSQNPAVQEAVISPIHRPLSPSPFSEPTPAQGGPPSAIDSDSVYSPPRESAFSLTTVIGATWILGACLAIAALVVSLVRVARLQREAAEIHDVAWRATARAVGVRLGWRRRVRLLVSDNVSTPMAGGIWRPTVFLPSACHGWTAAHRRVVLAHEIAHLASSDPVRHLMTRLAVAIYWFHPLAWLAARRADVAREEACDAAVLALGTRPSVYARVLLDLAESTAGGPRLLAVLPMIQPSLLEMRVMEILKGTRPAARRLGIPPAVAVGLFAVCIAAAQPAARATTMASALAATGPIIPSGSPMAAATPPPERSTQVGQVGQRADESGCWHDSSRESFSGSLSMTDVGGRTVIYEQIGTRGTTAIIQKRFDDLRLCFVAEDVGERGRTPLPSRWAEIAPRFLLEARRDGVVQQLEGTRDGGARRLTWKVGGRERPFDSAAEQWRDRMLAVLDTTWELSALYGQLSSLRGEISSILGERSSLQGEISSLRGHVSSLRGRISSIRGHESSLRGQISSIQGHLSSLRGGISSERGAISSLNAARYRASDADRTNIAEIVARHEAEVARLEQEIRAYDADARVAAVEREIKAFDAEGKIAALEAEIRAFDVDKKVADVERRIAALDVESKVAAIERKIAALDADRRGAQLKDRHGDEIKRLRAAIEAVR